MEKSELKHILGYLPYQLNAEYKEFLDIQKTDLGAFSNVEITGIDFQNNRVLIRNGYVTERDSIKPILRPLSDLTKEIEVNGEKFMPIIELAKLALSVKVLIKPIIDERFSKVTFEGHNEDYMFLVNKGLDFCLSNISFGSSHNIRISNQIQLFEKLYECHFDIHDLIGKGLAIDINTLTK